MQRQSLTVSERYALSSHLRGPLAPVVFLFIHSEPFEISPLYGLVEGL